MERVRERDVKVGTWHASQGTNPGTQYTYSGDFTRKEKIIDHEGTEASAYYSLRRFINRRRAQGKEVPARTLRTFEWMRKTRDLGSPMSLQRAEFKSLGGDRRISRKYVNYVRDRTGHLFPTTPPSSLVYLQPTAVGDLLDAGAECISACRPGSPQVQLAVAIGELWRDGLPTVPGVHTYRQRGNNAIRNGAGEYLNTVFGLRPLLDDLHKTFQAVKNSEFLWDKYVAEQSRPLHRRFGLPPTETTVVSSMASGYGYPVGAGQLYGTAGSVRKVVHTKVWRWFEGVFRYDLPDRTSIPSSVMMDLEKIHYLYGLDVDPVTIWNLIPWSWLVDWVFNFGGMLDALSSLMHNGLIMQYGYMMEHVIETTTWSLLGATDYNGAPLHASSQLVRENKRRIRASPFGFGINSSDFSAEQLAILASIGITWKSR